MTEYRIELDGHLDLPWRDSFGAASLVHQPDGTTCLTVSLPDQSALFGLLLRLHGLGLELLSLRRMTGLNRKNHVEKGV